MHAGFGQCLVYSVRDDVDRAPDGGAALEQRGGAAGDFDALDQQGVERDRVVGTDVGRINGISAVLQHSDAGSPEGADNGAAGAGTEVGGADAGLIGQQFTERRGLVLVQLVAAKHRRGLGDLALAASVGMGGDDEVVEMDGLAVLSNRPGGERE